MKDDFASSVTHELRTPLASIRAFSEILQDDPKSSSNNAATFWGSSSARPSDCPDW